MDTHSISLLKIIEQYLAYYASGKGHTARAKRLDTQHFVTFLTNLKGYDNPEKLLTKNWDFSSVQQFVDECLRKGESPATVARRLATLKHMGRTLSDKIPGFTNPAREVKAPKVKTLVPKAILPQEIKSIREKAEERKTERNSFTRVRNETIFYFLLDTGLRADEARLLKRSQVDEKLSWIKNVRTKGRQYRNVYITSAVRPILKSYLETREKELKRFFPALSKRTDMSLPFFISSYKASTQKPESFFMGAKSFWRAIRELSTDTPLHPHLLRHSYALDLLEHTNDIRLVSQALGHSDVKITMRYTERKDEEIARVLEMSRKQIKVA